MRKRVPCYTSSPSRFQNEFLDAYIQPVSLLHSGTAISREAIIRPLPFLSFSAAIYFGVFVPGGRGLWPSTWPLSLDREEEGEKRKECRERGRNAGRPKKRRALWERKEAEQAGGAAQGVFNTLFWGRWYKKVRYGEGLCLMQWHTAVVEVNLCICVSVHVSVKHLC